VKQRDAAFGGAAITGNRPAPAGRAAEVAETVRVAISFMVLSPADKLGYAVGEVIE
jgi:hypothetical protein